MKIRGSEYQSEYWLRVGVSLLSFIYCLFFTLSVANASQVVDLSDIGVGARALGMGKAFTAVADDGSALLTNPSGLALSSGLKVMSMAGNLMGEVPYTVLGVSYPLFNGVLGVSYLGAGVGGIKETRLNGITPEVTGDEGSFGAREFNLSYAKDLGKAKVGINLKLVSQGFSGTPSFEGGNGSGLDFDLGALAFLNEETKVGLTIKNLIPGNNLGSDELPMVIVGGVSKFFPKQKLTGALDAEINRTLLLHAGLEWNPVELLRVRVGLDQKPSFGGSITNFSTGLGLTYRGFSFDYAYHTYAELGEFSTHFFSLGYVGEEKKGK